MFTGIVEHIGTVVDFKTFDGTQSGGQGASVTITDCTPILGDCHIGDSIAVNGICLTATEFNEDTFKVGISPETVSRTNVSSWQKGAKVNVERAVSQEVRFGGHYVQGHVDTVATIVSKEPQGNSLIFGFKLRDAHFNKFIVEKGYIAIDGTSLTVTTIDEDDTFYISMIKHTQEHVVLPFKSVGEVVNIEVDVTGKVIERQIESSLKSQMNDRHSTLNKFVTQLVEERLNAILAPSK
ncbi:RIB5 (YBR256C) [Zygosaccharomyces parabailii]|uniref:Riboflavin synthase n=1 Tax=Zygosaccharomyces bailii (strain CLIB 213 / ATCC 58445 / CBS 680 / BCRC 21525 / NBRC 1098 / NCYC 1416 / NRRL Y-2227) TaxID=1333698 RepID=A0A8J2X6T9_ZYGB2|nr:RIB5 (YBR256C) [Zygosaccharomyces parabailii]CDF88117.1 BN860_02718g1_1 [Zygosaccharomyces bailii CLIB 213]CDH09053.1 probable Riboflavin synthase alpha chain [Zygosaccharomyces bailii ISA1307]